MSTEHGYYRHPAIHRNAVVFVCEDDLWTVPVEGGTARRLTANPGTAAVPAFSPDGTRIAFTGRDEGSPEVYVMDAEGGPPRRLTWLGSFNQVVGWSPDGRGILFASDYRQPFKGAAVLHRVPAEGGPVQALDLGPARAISYEPEGPGVVLGRNSADPARWKRYRGGTAGRIWIDRKGDGSFAPLITLQGNNANPMWIGSRIYFLSDHEGYGNVYSCTPTGRGLRRHTDHEDYYVRFPSTDGRRIVFHAGADLFIYDCEDGTERRIDIRMASPQPQRNRKFVPAARYLESAELHPQGHSIATVNRGGIYAMGLWEGAPRRVAVKPGVRHRLAAWLPDGKRIVAVSDEGGEEGLVVVPASGPNGEDAASEPEPRRIPGDFGRAIHLAPAPAGDDRVVLTNQRQEAILVDLASGRSKVIERSPYNRIEGISWSPDGRWIAYGFPNSNRTSRIHLYDTVSGRITPATGSDFHDYNPAFDPEGRFLYFLSFRIFDPVYDSVYFDLGFPKGSRPFVIPLKREMPSPFAAVSRSPRAPGLPTPPSPDAEREFSAAAASETRKPEGREGRKPRGGARGRGAEKATAPPATPTGEKREGPPAVEIDLENIAGRIVAVPVPEGIYGRVLGAKGRILFTVFPVEGSLDMTWAAAGEPPAKGVLQAWNLEEDKIEAVSDRVTDFALSADAKVLHIRSGNRIRVLPAAYKAEGRPPKEEPGRESGWINLDRIRVEVIPGEEWRQMFREAWRLQRDQFWNPDMSGIDWKQVHDRYLPLVDRVATRSEFSDLMWEMQGELGTSHCYELGGDYRPEPTWFQGFLGADLEFEKRRGAWRVIRVPQGDSWDEKKFSPLAAPGINVEAGDEIIAVNGEPVGADLSPEQLLVNAAGQDVEITVRSGGRRGRRRSEKSGQIRTVAVRTLRDETALRYRDWVEANRAWVHEQSEGRIGYVHIPNMGPIGYSEFHRYFLTEVEHEGLIVDVRWNGGGHVSQILLEKLLRKRIGYDANRWGQPTPYPADAPMGPMVALTNEYAGSDGDIFSHCFKLVGLGPLIGTRTWGGVVGIWPRHALVDGSITTQPEFAFWFKDVSWGVENYGTDPDITVEIKPQDHKAGRDPQMERGLSEVLKLVRKQRPAIPDLGDRPSRNPGRLSH